VTPAARAVLARLQALPRPPIEVWEAHLAHVCADCGGTIPAGDRLGYRTRDGRYVHPDGCPQEPA